MSLQTTLEKLIRFRSITGDHEETEKIYQWVREEMKDLPVYFEEFDFDEWKSMTITTKKGQRSPKVWLMSHVDVVDGSDAVFEPRVEGGRLYGRGAFDMKNAAAMFIELFKELGDDLKDYDIGILLTPDEEIGGFKGTKLMIEEAGLTGEVALLPEAGGTSWHFAEHAKGLWHGDIVATGLMTHGSRVWEGESATQKLIDYLKEVEELFDGFKTDDPGHWYSTCNIASLSAPFVYNQVADYAKAKFDIRFTTPDVYALVKKEMEKRAEKYGITIETAAYADAYGIDRHEPHLEKFAEVAKELFAIECGFTHGHGTDDGRFFANHGVPVLDIWATGGGHHSENEWIDLADLGRYYAVVKEWIKKVGHDDVEGLSVAEVTEETKTKKKKAVAA